MSKKDLLLKLINDAGISTEGDAAEFVVHNEHLYGRILAEGTLGAGEAYMDGWWGSSSLDGLMTKLIRARIDQKVRQQPFLAAQFALQVFWSRVFNKQSIARSRIVGEQHYDVGNDLYERMLDPWMQYTSGYWKEGVTTLNESQEAKLALIAQKLCLKPGMRVLDVGCGWGGLAKYLAQEHGVNVTGITISKEQASYAKKWTEGDSVSIEIVDYRELKSQPFDRIVSVGMFEHVGYKNYKSFLGRISSLMADDGIFLLDCIGTDETRYTMEAWIDKYIFPNSLIPSVSLLSNAAEGIFVMEDWHTFGVSYDKTLMAWYENFKKAWPELSRSKKYDERFYRMWEYYLLICAGFFRSRQMNQWQVVFSKRGLADGYTSIR